MCIYVCARVCVCLCVQACVREVWGCTVCLTTLTICLHGCVCVCVCTCSPVQRRGVEELGLKRTRSTSQRLGGPSPALVPHVNPTTPKIGQWNTTLSQTRRNKILKNTYIYINNYIHTERQTRASVSTQRITVCQSRQCLVARLRPAFNTTTHIFLQHRHVPWTGTTGLRRKKNTPPTQAPSPSHATSHLRQ